MKQTPAPITVGVADAAHMLGICERSVAYLIQSGRLPSQRLGRRRLIRVADLRELVRADRPGDIVPEVAK